MRIPSVTNGEKVYKGRGGGGGGGLSGGIKASEILLPRLFGLVTQNGISSW